MDAQKSPILKFFLCLIIILLMASCIGGGNGGVPVANNDTTTTDEDTPVTTGNVLANDTDVDGGTLQISSFVQASNGTVVDNGDGTFTYTPNTNFNGTDTFTYTVSDGKGGIATATVTVTVTSVNDAPVVTTPIVDVTVNEDAANTVLDLEATFADVDTVTNADDLTLTINRNSDPCLVTGVLAGTTLTLDYKPDQRGTATITVRAADLEGQVVEDSITITVTPVNDPPVALDDTLITEEDSLVTTDTVLINDADVDRDVLRVSSFTQAHNGTVVDNGDGTFIYIPNGNFLGADTFTYTVSDGKGGIATATVTVTVHTARPVNAATIIVNSFAQSPGAAGDCTLGEAIVAANTDAVVDNCAAGSGADIITLPTGIYTLTAVDNTIHGMNGLPSITSKITIDGNGSTIERNAGIGTPAFRIIHVEGNGLLELNHVTISGGLTDFPDVTAVEGDGGGIFNKGTLTLTNSTIFGNVASDDGGGIENVGGTLVITHSIVSDNVAGDEGGGIRNNAGTLTIIDSTVANNTAQGAFSVGADGGGGIDNGPAGQMTVSNSTLNGNNANKHGGGIRNFGIVNLNNVSITNNTAGSDNNHDGDGGGIYTIGPAFVRNTRIAGNLGPIGDPDCHGLLTSIGFNVIGMNTDCICLTALGNQPLESIRFAVIGDYGLVGQAEADVATLVKSWNPDFIITTGDNNYPNGAASTVDPNIGQYYHEFIYPYQGLYGLGAALNRFFPSLGNHDWNTDDAVAYFDYFTLPGNERYYDFRRGAVHFFAIDGDLREPDGTSSISVQAQWLQSQLAASTAPFKFVYTHYSPYSSGPHGSISWMQWPYKEWGADAVLAGHDHTYERIMGDGFPYFVNGLGGNGRYALGTPISGSEAQYNADYGAMLVDVTATRAIFKFISRAGQIIDSYTINKDTQLSSGDLSHRILILQSR